MFCVCELLMSQNLKENPYMKRDFFFVVKGTDPPWKKVVKYTRIICQHFEDVLLNMFVFFLILIILKYFNTF